MKKKITLSLTENILTARTASGITKHFAFPAAAISLAGVRIELKHLTAPPVQRADGGWCAFYTEGKCSFKVTVTPGNGEWFFKQIEVTASEGLPTPDYLEVDFQKLHAPGLRSCGYLSTRVDVTKTVSEEEGAGIPPGCGYPLAGADLFTGLEHPAAFNTLLESAPDGTAAWQLRHFPVWQGGKITSYRAVTGLGNAPRELFWRYLEEIRLPKFSKPFINFCTFWCDPYIGDFEYLADETSYTTLFNSFKRLGLIPDGFTLDAGWQERKSFFAAKECYGGEKALQKLSALLKKSGVVLGLWVSPNGPVGMDMEFVKSQGIAVGGGISCHYSGDGYAVLLDEKLENIWRKRTAQLASEPYGVRMFKVDWDNECATAPQFSKRYPTCNHVREATINIMAGINKMLRAVDPGFVTRNGRWPSPWHLGLTSHISLTHGGDCEYSDLPAQNQRDSSTTHRDTVYYCAHVRDNAFVPLDVYDNHEFSHAVRNPFQESPAVWSNTCLWAVMRGSSYHQYTLQPESLEDWQTEIFKESLALLRSHAPQIITGRSVMTGGNPARGEIYGFFHPATGGEGLLGLRNPSPLPQNFTLPAGELFYQQTYPDWRTFKGGELITFAPHEVKVFELVSAPPRPRYDVPCQLRRTPAGKYHCFLPASMRSDVGEIHQIHALELLHADVEQKENGVCYTFGVRVPYRMRNFKLCFKVASSCESEIKAALFTSRFKKARSSYHAAALTELAWGTPGRGARENPDILPEHKGRYFTADLPQGGEVFCRLEFSGAPVAPEELELWVTGFEAPAREREKKTLSLGKKHFVPLPHPDGFPLNLRLW